MLPPQGRRAMPNSDIDSACCLSIAMASTSVMVHVTVTVQLVRAYLDTAVASSLRCVMRIWAQTVGFSRAPFQTSPGVYNENRGLDCALDQVRQRVIKVGCASPSVAYSQLPSLLFFTLPPRSVPSLLSL